MKHIIAAVLAIAATQAHADEWTGADKQKHFAVHVVSGAAVRTIFPSLTDTEAVAVATIPGVIKELHDARSGGSGFSGKDMVWNIAGAFVGVKLTGWVLTRQRDTVSVSYSTSF